MSQSYDRAGNAANDNVSLESGQFLTRYGAKCADCGDFIRKNEVAGYNSDDEVVCEGCWTPRSEW